MDEETKAQDQKGLASSGPRPYLPCPRSLVAPLYHLLPLPGAPGDQGLLGSLYADTGRERGCWVTNVYCFPGSKKPAGPEV